MKKILLAVAAVALLFATSCKKESINPAIDIPEGSFLATIDNGAMPQNAPRVSEGMTTKTTIDDKLYVLWESGDQISINGSIYTTSTAGNSVVFSGGSATGSEFHAFYPASIAGTDNAGTLPATQTYVSGKVSNLPMYATSTNNQLTFHNICAVFAVKAPDGVNVASIEISTTDNKALWGTFGVDANNTAVMSQSVDDAHKKVTLECSNASSTGNIFYIALPAETYNNIKVTITTEGGSKLVRETNAENDPAKARTLEVNKIYSLNFSPVDNCFRFKAIDAGATININNDIDEDEEEEEGTPSDLPQFEYSTDGYYWSAYTLGTDITMANIGDSVMFRAPATHPNTNMAVTEDGDYPCYFVTSEEDNKVAVKGNIMMLLNGTNPSTDLSGTQYAFSYLFQYLGNLQDASALVLPNTVGSYCYQSMFEGCTSLETAPALPAETLANSCYLSMFDGCTSLETAPTVLPATTLANSCYESMFYGCESLETAPALPATTLAESCYQLMFSYTSLVNAPAALPATTLANSCYRDMFSYTPLVNAPALPATTLADHCYEEMFSECTLLENAPTLPATTLAKFCYNSMFSGCTSLETAPELPATTLTINCYEEMFYNCRMLSSVTMKATDVSANDCLTDWLDNAGHTTSTPVLKVNNAISTSHAAYNDIDDNTPDGWAIETESGTEIRSGW